MTPSLSYARLAVFTWSMTLVGASEAEKPCVTEGGCTKDAGSNTDDVQMLQLRTTRVEDGEIASREVVSEKDSWKFNDAFIYNAIERAKSFGYTFEARGEGYCRSSEFKKKSLLSTISVGGTNTGNYRLEECTARCSMNPLCRGYTTDFHGGCYLYSMGGTFGTGNKKGANGEKCYAKVYSKPQGKWVEHANKRCSYSYYPWVREKGKFRWVLQMGTCKTQILENQNLCEPVLQTHKLDEEYCACLRFGRTCDFNDGSLYYGWNNTNVSVFEPDVIATVDDDGWPWKIEDGDEKKYCRNSNDDKKLLFAKDSGVPLQKCMYTALFDEDCGDFLQANKKSKSCYCIRKGKTCTKSSRTKGSDVYTLTSSLTPAPPPPAPASEWVPDGAKGGKES